MHNAKGLVNLEVSWNSMLQYLPLMAEPPRPNVTCHEHVVCETIDGTSDFEFAFIRRAGLVVGLQLLDLEPPPCQELPLPLPPNSLAKSTRPSGHLNPPSGWPTKSSFPKMPPRTTRDLS